MTGILTVWPAERIARLNQLKADARKKGLRVTTRSRMRGSLLEFAFWNGQQRLNAEYDIAEAETWLRNYGAAA